jgi:hypothetical protein
MTNRISSSYLHQLQRVYYNIGDRGIRVAMLRVEANKLKIKTLINEQLEIASKQWSCVVYVGAANKPADDKTSVNLNSTQGERALLSKLKELGYKIPSINKKNTDREYESKFSTGELALQKMLVENQFNYPAGDPAIRAILKVRELGKISSVYLNSRLRYTNNEAFFLSVYNVAGTLTGRRTSRKHIFGFGNNSQNFPHHSSSARYFRECLIPREGNIFLMCDQMQAEEWPVSALSSNMTALEELKTGVDRHSKLASAVFSEYIPAKSSPDWDKAKHEMKRYLGKKIKHARNYGMKKKRMAESLAQEGFAVSEQLCEILLNKAREVDPTVDSVFHAYIQEQLSNFHMLKTPFGMERMFLGARPNADNSTFFNKAYSYIPQSVVGCNTGFAVFELEEDYPEEERQIVQEGHDSIVQDIRAEPENILRYIERTVKAFNREIEFHNGIRINIPIEFELGFDFQTTVTLESLTLEGIKIALDKLKVEREKIGQTTF